MGKHPGAAADEGAYPVEGRHLGGRRGMERQPDSHGFGHQYGHGCPDPSATGRGRLRGGADPDAFASLGRPRIFDGAAEAKLIALACSQPPKGRARWTLQLLEQAVVQLNIVERASDNTIGRTLKKTRSDPTCTSNG